MFAPVTVGGVVRAAWTARPAPRSPPRVRLRRPVYLEVPTDLLRAEAPGPAEVPHRRAAPDAARPRRTSSARASAR